MTFSSLSPSEPVSTETVPARVRGETANRLVIILRAPGCAYDLRSEHGCTYCNFRLLTSRGARVPPADLIAQVDTALAARDCTADRLFEIDVYNSGNFLNDDEVPPEARTAILRRVAREHAVRVVVVESRPEYITLPRVDALLRAGARRPPLAVEVGIGLESVDDTIRERYLRKGFTRQAFERAVRVLGESGADLLAYVMLKPMAMPEEDALREAVRTAEYVHEVSARLGVRARIALQPTFVVPQTPLAREYMSGCYSPPMLASVVEAARRIAPLGDLHVGLSDEGLHPLATPGACKACKCRLYLALREFNRSQDISHLFVPPCTAPERCC